MDVCDHELVFPGRAPRHTCLCYLRQCWPWSPQERTSECWLCFPPNSWWHRGVIDLPGASAFRVCGCQSFPICCHLSDVASSKWVNEWVGLSSIQLYLSSTFHTRCSRKYFYSTHFLSLSLSVTLKDRSYHLFSDNVRQLDEYHIKGIKFR